MQLVATEGVCTSAAGMYCSDITPIPDQDPRAVSNNPPQLNALAFEPARISLAMTRVYIKGVY